MGIQAGIAYSGATILPSSDCWVFTTAQSILSVSACYWKR